MKANARCWRWECPSSGSSRSRTANNSWVASRSSTRSGQGSDLSSEALKRSQAIQALRIAVFRSFSYRLVWEGDSLAMPEHYENIRMLTRRHRSRARTFPFKWVGGTYRFLAIRCYSERMRWFLTLSFGIMAVPAGAQIISGPAEAVDGDTLRMTGERIRLFGIDAPEENQTCQRGGEVWRCGEDASHMLASLIDGKPIECSQRDRDDYGRMVAVCRVGRIDLAQAMIDGGMAVALPQFATDYVEGESAAKTREVGLWGATFEMPSAYRAAHPQRFVRPAPQIEASASRAPTTRIKSDHEVYYRNCAAARAAGAAPLYRGQPGYRIGMDGDGDGVACEPYRGR